MLVPPLNGRPSPWCLVEDARQLLEGFLERELLARSSAELSMLGVRPLLQHNQAPQSPPRPHAIAGLQHQDQGQTNERQSTPRAHFRVRQDKVDSKGKVTVRYHSRLHHIGIGRAHKNRPIKLLIAPTETSASSTNKPASYYANSPSTTNQSTKPELSTMPRDIGLRCPDTSHRRKGGDSNPRQRLNP